MKNPEDIKTLAYKRLKEAQALCNAEEYDGAFYLAGYSIELMLKAKICRHWGVDNLFDFGNKAQNEAIGSIRNALKTHDIAVLLMLSGLKVKFDEEKVDNPILFETNALLFENSGKCIWSEQLRYQENSRNPEKVKRLILLLDYDDGLLKWISK